MKKTSLLCLVLFLMSLTGIAWGDQIEAGEKAITELKKLQAKIQIGITLSEYSRALGEAQFAVNQFHEELAKNTKDLQEGTLPAEEISKTVKMMNLIRMIMDEHSGALTMWKNMTRGFKRGSRKDNEALFELIEGRYPDYNKSIKDGGVFDTTKGKKLVYFDAVRNMLWSSIDKQLTDYSYANVMKDIKEFTEKGNKPKH
jgi:hypothetical protein